MVSKSIDVDDVGVAGETRLRNTEALTRPTRALMSSSIAN
jgi:hypothetical protein